jgi:hypothetical protein
MWLPCNANGRCRDRQVRCPEGTANYGDLLHYVFAGDEPLDLGEAGTAIGAGLESGADVGGSHATGVDGFDNRGLCNAEAGAHLEANVAGALGRDASKKDGYGFMSVWSCATDLPASARCVSPCVPACAGQFRRYREMQRRHPASRIVQVSYGNQTGVNRPANTQQCRQQALGLD